MHSNIKLRIKNQEGQLSLAVLLFGSLAIIILAGLIIWVDTQLKSAHRNIYRDSAFRIAESGIEYYRWHLAHDTDDYQDGTNNSGPYTHPYYDKDGSQIGAFTLTIAPPPSGGSKVVITSRGTIVEDPTVSRTLEETVAIPSFGQYAVLGGNAPLSFGVGVDVTGPVLGNNGVRFDGLAHNIVSSAVDKYTDGSPNMLGVHTNVSPADPAAPVANIPSRPDIFQAGREFPPFYNVVAVDFNALTATLSDLKDQSLTPSGFHLGKAPGNSPGYHIILKNDGTFDVYQVGKVHTDPKCWDYSAYYPGWEMGSIDPGGETLIISNRPYPTNGIIFVEDHLWLEGTINNNRLTIAAGSFIDNGNGNPQAKNITINHSVRYTNYDGRDVLGVIAQNNINIGLMSDKNLRIDGALISKSGRVGRFYFIPQNASNYTCGEYGSRDTLYLYGMMASYGASGFVWADGSGYQTRTIVYDSNLYYNPPPSFPKTSSQYSILTWREVLQ